MTFLCSIELRSGGSAQRIVTAKTADEARSLVESAGDCFVLDCRELGSGPVRVRGFRRVSSQEFIVFLRQWQTLQKAGVSVAQAIRGSLRQGVSSGLSRVMETAVGEIEGGRSVSESVAQHPDLFPPHFVASLSVAEKTGDLPSAIGRHIGHLSRMRELNRTIVNATTYPAFLLVAMVSVSLFLLVYVLPNFSQIYADSKVELPWLTVFFLSASSWLTTHWAWMIAGAVSLGVAVRTLWTTPSTRNAIERFSLSVPVVGPVVVHQGVVRFGQTLSTLIKGGFPLLDSLRLSIPSLPGRYLKDRFNEIAYSVEGGESFGVALRRGAVFPEVTVQLVEAGEKGGNLPEMLDQAVEHSEEDLKHRIRIATSLLEPVMMVLVGGLIAILVVAIYLPIFRLGAIGG